MGKEIEYKFLVTSDAYKKLGSYTYYKQGYLSLDKERTVRVRVVGSTGYITVKGRTTRASRTEFEYVVPVEDAVSMLDELCIKPLIEKKRYRIHINSLVWEVDEFLGENIGLVVAEVEVPYKGYVVEKPEWVGKEVTDDPRFFNSNLINYPYSCWKSVK